MNLLCPKAGVLLVGKGIALVLLVYMESVTFFNQD